jgi:hypothetical protein
VRGVIINTQSGYIGPFESVETLSDRLLCDGVDIPFSVIGSYTVINDDSLMPPSPPPPVQVPEFVSMRQARLALLNAGMLSNVNAAITAMPGAAGDAARIEWEYATEVRRDSALVTGLSGVLGLTSAQLDQLFIAGAEL